MVLGSLNTVVTSCLLSLNLASVHSFQAPQDEGSGRLMLVFMGITAISLLILTLVVVGTLIALAIVGFKAKNAIGKTVQEVKSRAYPLIEKSTGLVSDLTPTIKSIAGKADALVGDLTPTIKGITEKTHALIEDLSPKVSGITDDLHGITSRALQMAEFGKQKLEEFTPAITAAKETFMQANATVRSANDKTESQVERVNGMVTEVLDWTSRVPAHFQHGLGAPGRKLDQVLKQIQGATLIRRTKDLWKGVTGRVSSSKVPHPSIVEPTQSLAEQQTPAPAQENAFINA
jgi:hypothetical protein